jgi:hypothetical protein
MKFILVAATIGLTFTACKKNEDMNPATPADDMAQQLQSAADQTKAENESNKSLDEVSSIIDGISQTKSMQTVGCNVTIDSSNAATGLITLTFNGTNCDATRSRTGVITVQLPYNSNTQTVTRWHEAGCTLTLTFVNFAVTTLSDNKTFTFNGTHTVTNVSGGRLAEITSGTPLVHKIRANMQLTFDDGTTRTWGAARVRTFTLSNNVLSTQVVGDTAVSGYSNVAEWGINRAGENFACSITTPVVIDLQGGSCLNKPLSGVRVHHRLTHEITVTYGVDANGTPVSSGTCPYGFKANWINAHGVAKEVVRSY